MSKFQVAIAAVALSMVPCSDAFAYPFNPWGGVIPEKTAAFNPYLYVYPGPVVSPIPYVGMGFGHNADVWVGAGMNIAGDGGTGFGTAELFPRYFIGGKVGLSPHIFWTPGARNLVIAPEIHYGGVFDKFALTINAGLRPNFIYGDGGTGFDAGTAFAVVVPEYYITPKFAVFAEVHEYYNLPASANSNLIVPGFWVAFDDAAVHSVSVGLQIDPATGGVSGGLWYGQTFAL